MFWKSKTDIEDPMRPWEKIEKQQPRRTNDRKDRDDPIDDKSKTDIEQPKRAKLRREIEDPTCRAPHRDSAATRLAP